MGRNSSLYRLIASSVLILAATGATVYSDTTPPLLVDTFDGAGRLDAHTPTEGAGRWSQSHMSQFELAGGAVALVSTGEAQATLNTLESDIAIETNYTPPLTGTFSAGLIFRGSDEKSYYRLTLADTGKATLARVADGTSTALGSKTVTLDRTHAYALRVEATGASISAYIDGALIVSTSQTFNQTAGAHGLHINRANGRASGTLDNLSITRLGAGTPATTPRLLSVQWLHMGGNFEGVAFDGEALIAVDGNTALSTIYKYPRVSDLEWSESVLYQSPTEAEGLTVADFNNDGTPEVVVGFQNIGEIRLLIGDGQAVVLKDHADFVMSLIPLDLTGDGRPELVYAYEGYTVLTGGVGWLELVGNDPTNPAHWQDQQAISLPGAYWLEPLSLGCGVKGLALGVRQNAANPSGAGGLYSISIPTNPAQTWQIAPVQSGGDVVKVDSGNLTGGTSGLDLLSANRTGEATIYRYSGGGWQAVSTFVYPSGLMNVSIAPTSSTHQPFVLTAYQSAWWLYEWDGASYQSSRLMTTRNHPADNNLIWVDEGAGQWSLYGGDSTNYTEGGVFRMRMVLN